MTARLARIFRYPVKSIGGEELALVKLTAGQALPGDRRFAVLHQATLEKLDGGDLQGARLDRWLPKASFLRGAAAAPLQAIRGGWDGDALVLTHPDRPPLRQDPAADDAPMLDWLAPLWAASGKAPPARLVEGTQALSDVRQPWLSVLSLASLADLERRLGQPLGTARWRGNLWIDGWEPYAERDMQLHQIRIGEVTLKLTQRITRCSATSADTATGRIDIDMPAALQGQFDHSDFGIYAEVETGGTIRPGDRVEIL